MSKNTYDPKELIALKPVLCKWCKEEIAVTPDLKMSSDLFCIPEHFLNWKKGKIPAILE